MDYTIQLPTCIVDEIQETFVLEEGLSWTERVYSLYTVSGVSRTWRLAAIDNPNLWKDVVVRRCSKPPFITKALERAKGGDVTLRIDTDAVQYIRWGAGVKEVRCRTVDAFLEQTIPRLALKFSQVRGLLIEASDWSTALSLMVALSSFGCASRLRWFRTLVRIPSRVPLTVTPWLGNYALPDTVDLRGMFPTWAPVGAFVNLTTLRLGGISVDMRYGWPQLRAVLEATPKLFVLQLDSVCCVGVEEETTVSLPLLNTFNVGAANDGHWSYLPFICMPSITDVGVEVTPGTSLLQVGRAMVGALQRADRVRFAVQFESLLELADVVLGLTSVGVLDFRDCDPGVGLLLTALAKHPTFRLPRARRIHVFDEVQEVAVSQLLDKCHPHCTLVSGQGNGHLGEGFEWRKEDGVLMRRDIWFARYRWQEHAVEE